MKKLYLLLLVVCAQTFSQTEISKSLGEFSELKVYDLINVDLIKSTKNKIVISGKNSENLNIIQKNNTLKLKMQLKKKFNGKETLVKLYYTSLDIIDANQGAVVFSKGSIKQYELVLKAQEGAQIKADVDTKLLVVKSVTGAKVSTTGRSNKQEVNIRTGGVYKGANIAVENTDLDIKFGGEADVNTSNVLDVAIFSGGDVNIFGTPKQLKQRKIFGGRILFKN